MNVPKTCRRKCHRQFLWIFAGIAQEIPKQFQWMVLCMFLGHFLWHHIGKSFDLCEFPIEVPMTLPRTFLMKLPKTFHRKTSENVLWFFFWHFLGNFLGNLLQNKKTQQINNDFWIDDSIVFSYFGIIFNWFVDHIWDHVWSNFELGRISKNALSH